MFEMYIEATVRGYHAYLDNASVRIGEILACEMELANSHDRFAVAVKNQDGNRLVRVRALAGDTVLCSWARHLTLTVPLSTQGSVQ